MPESSSIDSDLAAVRDHSRTFEAFTFVYPVISRRSGGLSIGVNLNPNKRCNFDCVYCEVDRTTPGRAESVDPERMRTELVALVRSARQGELARSPRFRDVAELTRRIQDIAFSGDGEPTMIPNFAECVQTVADVRRTESLEEAKIVLITDAAGLDKADVRAGLEIMDANHGEIWGKLDAGTERYYRQVNRSRVRFNRILRNLLETARARPIVIQSLFLRMHGEPMAPDELEAYCGRLRTIQAGGGRIKEVHAYTVARPTPEPWATKLDRSDLEGIASVIAARTDLPVRCFE